MDKPQITVRLSPSLLGSLDQYIERTGTSKNEGVVSAIAQYLNCTEEMPLSRRLAEIERRVAELEAKEKVKEN